MRRTLQLLLILSLLVARNAWGQGVNAPVYALAYGSGTVYVGGEFTAAGTIPANHVAAWTGSEWSPLGAGVDGTVFALAVDGDILYVGGAFSAAGGAAATGVARWDGSNWHPVGGGVAGVGAVVKSLWVDGSGLLVGGRFDWVNESTPANGLARWSGSSWLVMGGIPPGILHDIRSIAVNDGTIYVGGVLLFPGSTRPDEATLSRATPAVLSNHAGSVNGGVECTPCTSVNAILADGNDLLVAGAFVSTGSAVLLGSPYSLVRLVNATTPVGLGDGTMTPMIRAGGVINALAQFNGSTFAGGSFGELRGTTARNLAGWNGGEWTAIGTGVSASVNALVATDSLLIAGGTFTEAGGTAVGYIAAWDGMSWSPLVASPLPNTTRSLGRLKSGFRR